VKVVHFAFWAPSASGQFESVREMILAERALGIDAQFCDCGVSEAKDGSTDLRCRVGLHDDKIEAIDPSSSFDADVLVRHTVIPQDVEAMGKPVVMCLHGRPENSFLLEYYKKAPVYSLLSGLVMNKQYKAFVYFWKGFEFYWSFIVPKSKLFYVPPTWWNVAKFW